MNQIGCSTRGKSLAFGFAALTLAVATWVLTEAGKIIRVDLTSLQARRLAMNWADDESGSESPAWEGARADLLAAIEMAPDNAALYDFLASLYAARGLARWEDEDQRRQFLEEALRQQQKAVALLPVNASGWAEVAMLRRLLQQNGGIILEDWKRAYQHGRNEADVQKRLASLALSLWADATPEMKSWLLERYQRASAQERELLKESADRFGVELDDELQGR